MKESKHCWTRAQKLLLASCLAIDALLLCGIAGAVYRLGYVNGQMAEIAAANEKVVCE